MFHVKLYGVAWEFYKGLVWRVVLNVSRGKDGGATVNVSRGTQGGVVLDVLRGTVDWAL